MRVFLLLVMAVLTSCATTISGTLVDEEGRPVTNEYGRVNITKLDDATAVGFQEIAAVLADGTFTTNSELAPGRYLIEALVPGYKTASSRIDLKESMALSMKLTPIPKVGPSVIGTNLDLEIGRGEGSVTINPPSF